MKRFLLLCLLPALHACAPRVPTGFARASQPRPLHTIIADIEKEF